MEDELIAHNHVTQAHEALKGGCCLNLFKSLADRRTEAREHYRNAGNLFKKCNKFGEAGECFERSGEISEQLIDKISNDYEESAHCYGQTDKKSKYKIYLRTTSNIPKDS